MKVFVDTNVWLSGLLGRGLCADLLDALIDAGWPLLLDERVLGELRRIAQHKFGVDDLMLARVERFLRQQAVLLPASAQAAKNIPGPDDAWIIAAALTADAGLFVTGDKALLALGAVEGLPIIDPRAAYLKLRGLD